MRSINRETMLTNNQHNQPAVSSEPDIILVEFFFMFLSVGWGVEVRFGLLLICPTAASAQSLSTSTSVSPSFSPPLSQSLSLPPRSRLLGFLAEHRDRRKKKKTEGRIYEGHPCYSVQPSTSLQITHTLCTDSKQCCGSLTSAQQGCDHDT